MNIKNSDGFRYKHILGPLVPNQYGYKWIEFFDTKKRVDQDNDSQDYKSLRRLRSLTHHTIGFAYKTMLFALM